MFSPNTSPKSNSLNCLLCKSFVMCGDCAYQNRCQYIHDPRITNNIYKSKTRRKNSEDETSDMWFWPKMPNIMLNKKIDGNPITYQHYNVPKPLYNDTDNHSYFEHVSMYSIWNHFINFIVIKNNNNDQYYDNHYFHNININQFTNKSRLPIFIALASC